MTDPLKTPADLARFLGVCGYDREQIRQTLVKEFPSAEPVELDELLNEAQDARQRFDSELAAEVEKDEQAALEAEHDLGRSMHRND